MVNAFGNVPTVVDKFVGMPLNKAHHVEHSEFLRDLEMARRPQGVVFAHCSLCNEYGLVGAYFEYEDEPVCEKCLASLVEEHIAGIPETTKMAAAFKRGLLVKKTLAEREEERVEQERRAAEEAMKAEIAAKLREIEDAKAEIMAKYAGKLPEAPKPVWETADPITKDNAHLVSGGPTYEVVE